jgi:hypothetical protein
VVLRVEPGVAGETEIDFVEKYRPNHLAHRWQHLRRIPKEYLRECMQLSVSRGGNALELELPILGLLGVWFAAIGIVGIGGVKTEFAQKPSPSVGCVLTHLGLLDSGQCGRLG